MYTTEDRVQKSKIPLMLWFLIDQMAEQFQKTKSVIGKHV
jgi:hypothetical protein